MGNSAAAVRTRVPTYVLSAALLVLLVTFGASRWTGHLPFGSDSDEYRLVARSLLRTGKPWVAGVEGSKYPPGYPAMLAVFEVAGLPAGRFALALNLLLVAGTAAVVFAIARRADSAGAGVVAAAALASSWATWLVAGYLTPDVAFAFVVAVAARLAAANRGFDRVLPAAAVSAAATLLRTAGVALSGAIALSALVDRPRKPRAAAAALAGSGLAILAQRLLGAGLPAHTTSYARDFWFRDPYDHSRGTLSLAGIAARALARVPDVGRDLGQTLGGAMLPAGVAIPIAVVALLLAVAVFPRRAFAAAFVILLLGTMLIWPFSGVHFCVPLVPLAATGFGVAFARSRRSVSARRRAGAAAIAAVLAVTAASGFRYLRSVSASERETLPVLENGAADLAAWIAGNVPPADAIASFDYREVALRTGRTVLPVAYTSDTAALWAMTGGRGARWLVASDLVYPLRGEYAARLVASRPACFVPAHRNPAFRVYRIGGPGCAAGR